MYHGIYGIIAVVRMLIPLHRGGRRSHEEVNRKIVAEYAQPRDGWRRRDLKWFRRPSVLVCGESLDFKQTWLKAVATVKERNVRRNTEANAGQRTMDRYLSPIMEE